MEHIEDDYRNIPLLDKYDRNELADDSEEVEEMDYATRKQAEQEMDEKDRGLVGRRWRGRDVSSSDDEGMEVENEAGEIAARGRLDAVGDGANLLNTPTDMLRAALRGTEVHDSIVDRFAEFLRTFEKSSEEEGSGDHYYLAAIRMMCNSNKQSLQVSFIDLAESGGIWTQMSDWLALCPDIMLEYMNEAAKRVVLEEFPTYSDIHQEIYVRFYDVTLSDKIRDLRSSHLGKLIRTVGVVTRRTSVFPQMLYTAFKCSFCGSIIDGVKQQSEGNNKPDACMFCQRKGGLQFYSEKTVYRNFQKITLQESPGSVPAGRIPRNKEVILTADLIDTVRPGDEIDLTGRYTNNFDMAMNMSNGFPVFHTIIEANNVQLRKDVLGNQTLSEEDQNEIYQLAADKNLERRILCSIAPSIFGHDNVKLALALSLFGGQFVFYEKHRIRGDINVLLMGDPGVAKSQFLKYAERTSPRAVYTTGKGASAVGLTAAVHRDPVTGEWTLEGGALVLSDRGVCLIDEFDKMNDMDRVSIHEAMEQQSISISKAGIVTTLQARCAVIAAANPKTGRYNPSKSFNENVELTDPIIQRFDVLCVIPDRVDPVEDERLAKFVVDNHIACHPEQLRSRLEGKEEGKEEEYSPEYPSIKLISQQLLKKYILYAKTHCNPVLDDIDQNKIAQIYAKLRRENTSAGGIPVAVRHIESVIRMAEAHARMHLRDHVLDEDVNVAISIMLDSFINSQKHSVKEKLKRTFRPYLIFNEDNYHLYLHELKELVKEQIEMMRVFNSKDLQKTFVITIPYKDLEDKLHDVGTTNLIKFVESSVFKENGFVYNAEKKEISREFATEGDSGSA